MDVSTLTAILCATTENLAARARSTDARLSVVIWQFDDLVRWTLPARYLNLTAYALLHELRSTFDLFLFRSSLCLRVSYCLV